MSSITKEQCIEFARLDELRLHHWRLLTGVTGGGDESFNCCKDGVFPVQYTDHELSILTAAEQFEIGEICAIEPLRFPCSPSELLRFIDGLPIAFFEVPDDFRQALIEQHGRFKKLASEQQLHIDHWIELTGVGVGQHESYFVANDRVAFRKWEDDFIAAAPAKTWQVEMLNDNRVAPELAFPCPPRDLLRFVDTAIGIHCFMVPEAFRDEVERLDTSETERAESNKPAGDWKNQRIGWRKSVVAIWPELLNLYRRKPTVEKLVEELEKNDREGYVVPSGVPDELKWRQVKNKGGEPKTVSRDTIEDFISSLPGYRAYDRV